MSTFKKITKSVQLGLLIAFSVPAVASAAQSSSSSYQVNEVFFGNGGALNVCSSSYCSKQSSGETTVGNPSGSSYQAHAGFNTNREPYIEFTVNSTNIDLGTLTPGTTKTANATFSVKAYLASGYVVTTESDPPTNGSYTMQAPSTPTASDSGSEQFGINLVANTSPVSFGSDPAQVPDSSFSYGQVASGYDTANQYKYVKGDTVAYSDKSSGETDYTISYIFNITNLTPGGVYKLHQVLVATATF